MKGKQIIFNLTILGVVILMAGIRQRALAMDFDFDSGNLQGWTMYGIYAYSTYPTQHTPNPFTFSWDDSTQYPGTLNTNPHSDPLGNNLGSAAASTANLTLPPSFPVGDSWWFVDLVSNDVHLDPQWQNFTGLAINLRGDVGVASSVQVLLNATRKSDNQEVWLREENHAGAEVYHDINTDSQTNLFYNPYHWMNLYPQFPNISDYIINNVRLRIWGFQTGVTGKINVDNVVATYDTPILGIQGTVTCGFLGECGNFIDIIYESDVEPAPELTFVRIDFTGTGVLVGSLASLCGAPDYRLIGATKVSNRIIELEFSGFDPGERFRLFPNLNQLNGTGTPVGSNYVGGTVELTFAGLPGTCTNPLTGTFVYTDTFRGTATFSCVPDILDCYVVGYPRYYDENMNPGPAITQANYDAWVAAGKPDCWCCPHHGYGDVNGDGSINPNDVPIVWNAVKLGLSPARADVNHDGSVNPNDVPIVWNNVKANLGPMPNTCADCP